MSKNNNNSQDGGSSASSAKERMRTRKTDSSNKIELEQIDHKNDISTTHQEEFREDITRQYSRSTQPGSLLNEQEKPHLKRALKARHVSVARDDYYHVSCHSTCQMYTAVDHDFAGRNYWYWSVLGFRCFHCVCWSWWCSHCLRLDWFDGLFHDGMFG